METPKAGDFIHMHQRKPIYPIGDKLRAYMRQHDRELDLPIAYEDLLRYDGLLPVLDDNGNETLWNTVLLRQGEVQDIHERLVETYQALTSDGRHIDHLIVESISFCAYGNSQPFRIKIVNTLNENHDYYYIKRADASRIYGLELEHLLSPNHINYMCIGNTIVEEHIIGVPGDIFIKNPASYGGMFNEVRICKEFVKFNERCFVRLLGDMRAYNFVVDVIHDIDRVQYRIRCIDFDQQNYEGRARIYLPQFYKENLPYVELAQRILGKETAEQYRNEERALLRKRYRQDQAQMDHLLSTMDEMPLSTPDHIAILVRELSELHGSEPPKAMRTMGEVLAWHLRLVLQLDR